MAARLRSSQPLQPLETATAAVMAATAVAILVLGSVIRHAGPIQLATTVPYGLVAYRHRPRAVVAAAIAGAFLTLLLVGTGGAVGLLGYAAVGLLIGDLKRRGRGVFSVLLASCVLGAVLAVLADAVMLVFGSYRRLVFATVQSTVAGIVRALERAPALRPLARELNQATTRLLTHWEISFAAAIVAATPAVLVLVWILLGGVLDRLRWISADQRLATSPDRLGARPVAPVPVLLKQVGFRYAGVRTAALIDVSLTLEAGQFVAVVGDNGSGKSTLARVLAGAQPSSGNVERPGSAGLGAVGGTAMILQRPDSQILGSRVGEDVTWGLPPEHVVDVDRCLTEVGLAGTADRETSGLSGGQLQRLALAAALARRPALLISDESTAMIDPDGRRDLVALLADLTRSHGMTVVHVTHSEAEASAADRVIRLDAGRVVSDHAGSEFAGHRLAVVAPMTARQHWPPEPARGPARLALESISHTYALGTPWEHHALHDVDFSVAPGEGVLVVGDNGSGKSTLAWIAAGLLRPSAGQCRLGDRPAHEQRGRVGLAFQHSRLQLQRPTVGADIADAAGWSSGRRAGKPGREHEGAHRQQIDAALRMVGLPPSLAAQGIDQLSGGQLRRVAIAGLLAREPRVLILDEPFAGLDILSRQSLLSLLATLRGEFGVTLLIVSHDAAGMSAVCSRSIRLHAGAVVADELFDEADLHERAR